MLLCNARKLTTMLSHRTGCARGLFTKVAACCRLTSTGDAYKCDITIESDVIGPEIKQSFVRIDTKFISTIIFTRRWDNDAPFAVAYRTAAARSRVSIAWLRACLHCVCVYIYISFLRFFPLPNVYYDLALLEHTSSLARQPYLHPRTTTICIFHVPHHVVDICSALCDCLVAGQSSRSCAPGYRGAAAS